VAFVAVETADSGRDDGEPGSRPLRQRPSIVAAALATLEHEQDRWFLWVPVLFGAGVIFYFRLPTEPAVLTAFMPLAGAVALAALWRQGALAVVTTSTVLAVALGFAAAKLRAEWVHAPILERQLGAAELRGFVELIEPRATRGARITLRVSHLAGRSAEQRPRRVRVRVNSVPPGLEPGDAIKLRATLAPPALPALPGDYDFARAAWFQGLGGVGYAMAAPVFDPDAGPAPLSLRVSAAIERVRQAIGSRVLAGLPGETGAIANALVTGERGGISQATNDAFRDSGLFHILSISGLHMTVMAGAVFLSIRLLLAALPPVALRFPIKKWAAVVAVVAAFGYLLISGSTSATIRSWIMISLMFLAVLLDRPAVALRNVALAALAILIVFPESVFDVGFQMSFAAVVALVATFEELRERARQRREALFNGTLLRGLLFFGGIVLTTLVASIAVAPFAAYHFHKTQQFAILANLIAIPICNLIVMPGALLTLVLMPFGAEAAPLWLMGLGIEGMVWCAYAVADLPGAVGRIPAIPEVAFALMVMGGLWFLLWRTRWRVIGLTLAAAGLAVAPALPRPDILIGRDGHLVAIRTADERLSALPVSGSTYELQRWLEHDGDARTAREAIRQDTYRCDALGCTATIKGQLIAVAHHPGAVADDCSRAKLLILNFPKPRGCQSAGTVIDFFELREKGTHAVYVNGGALSVTTVADMRGDRPWSPSADLQRRSRQFANSRVRDSRITAFAAPRELFAPFTRPRPEIEDEDGPNNDDRDPPQ
jgi:competence protein ComEC